MTKPNLEICEKKDAYACLKSGCDFAEAADCQFICYKPRFYPLEGSCGVK